MSRYFAACLALLCRLLNWSPLFHVSCDSSYGAYVANFKVRFSFLALSIGLYKFYFLTYCDGRFSPYFVLSFGSVMPYPSLQLVDQKAGSYSSDMQITNRSEDDLKVQYEFLKEAYNNACSVKSSMLAKVSSHASAYFVLAGFYAYVFNELWKLDGWQKDFSVVFISIGALFLLTAGVFTFSFLQVSGGVRARFHDIRALNGSTTLSQAKHAYINWFASKSENLVLASKIKNIELNVVVAFLLIVVLWLFVFFSGADSGLKGGLQYESDLELQILNGDGVLDKEELSRLFDIVNSSDTRSADQYIVLSSNSADAEIYSGVVGMIKLVVGSSKVSELRLSSSSGFKDRIVIKIKKEG